MNHIRLIGVAMTLLMISASQGSGQEKSPGQLFEEAVYTEQTVGDLDAALKIYGRIVAQHEKSKAIFTQAQRRIRLIKAKVGDGKTKTATSELDDAFKKITEHYVDPITIDANKTTEAALREVLGNLDQYSSYIDADTLKDFYIGIEGKLVGIGAQLKLHDGKLTVVSPVPGSPALEAGLKPEDIIVSVDGKLLADFSDDNRVTEAVKLIRGKAGDEVDLAVISDGTGIVKSVRIIRREITLPSLSGVTGVGHQPAAASKYRFKDHPEIGYVGVTQIGKTTSSDLKNVLTELQDQNIKGLIIDVRQSPGGLLKAAVEIADMFLADGLILKVQGRKKTDNSEFNADKDQILKDVPIAILVNRRTASAAEVIAGTLQKLGRAVIIGERTYGKGTVQALFQLKSGGAIKLTTARFYLADGETLEKPLDPKKDDTWGVNPTEGYLIESTEAELDVKVMPDPTAAKQPDAEDRAVNKAIEFLSR